MQQLSQNVIVITKRAGTDKVLNTSLTCSKETQIHKYGAMSEGVWKMHFQNTFYQLSQKHKHYSRFTFLKQIRVLTDV